MGPVEGDFLIGLDDIVMKRADPNLDAAVGIVADAVAELDGEVSAQLELKTDAGGAIAGIGLRSEAGLGAEIVVRANRFGIVLPGADPETDSVTVFAAGTVDGEPAIVIPVSLYADEIITERLFETGATSTRAIAPAAVTTSTDVGKTTNTDITSATWVTVLSAVHPEDEGYIKIFLTAGINVVGGDGVMDGRITRGGTVIKEAVLSVSSGFTSYADIIRVGIGASAARTYRFEARMRPGNRGDVRFATMVVEELKR